MARERVISGDVWNSAVVLEAARIASRRLYCIAYLTRDSVSLFRPGDLVICDASPKAVACGETDPRILEILLSREVGVFSCEALHAKCAVFDDWVLLGSANMSESSALRLVELSVFQKDSHLSAQVQGFILGLIRSGEAKKLDAGTLGRLRGLWQKDRTPWQGAVSRRKTPRSTSKARNHVVTIFNNVGRPRGITQDELNESNAHAEELVEKNEVSLRGRILDSYYTSEKWSPGKVQVGDRIVAVVYSSRQRNSKAKFYGVGSVVLIERRRKVHIVHYIVPDTGVPFGVMRRAFGYGRTVNRSFTDQAFEEVAAFVKKQARAKRKI